MKRVILFVAVLLASVALMAQDGQGPQGPQDPQAPPPAQGQGGGWRRTAPRMPMNGGPRMRTPGPGGMAGRGKWWKNSEVVKDLGLTDAQVSQIEKSFQDHRMQLVDLHATLQKAELGLEPMMQADQPNETQVIAQIDKIAQARAALEKSNAQMLLGVRRILTVDQWKKLQAERQRRPEPRPGAFRPGSMQRRMRPGAMPGPGGMSGRPPAAPTEE